MCLNIKLRIFSLERLGELGMPFIIISEDGVLDDFLLQSLITVTATLMFYEFLAKGIETGSVIIDSINNF